MYMIFSKSIPYTFFEFVITYLKREKKEKSFAKKEKIKSKKYIMSEGQITRKDIITDEALNWGADYAKEMEVAIAKNKEFAASVIAMNEANNKLRKSQDQTEYKAALNEVNLESKKVVLALKERLVAETNLEKVKQEALKTEKLSLDAASKREAATRRNTKLTVEERLQNEINNRVLKQEALERLGLVSAYTKLNKQRTDAKNKLRDLIAAESASTSEIKKATIEFNKFDAKVKKADQAVGDFSKNVGNYKSVFSGLGSLFAAFGIAGGIAGIISATKEIYNTTKELQSLDLALKSVTGTEENFGKQQVFLTTIADKYGLEIKNLTKQYTAFYVAAKDKLAAGEIQDLFENIAKSGSALGLSNETLERSFVALNQMLSKGTVASEELRGQLAEALPGSVQAMTKAVQKLHPEIKNLTEKGLFEMIKSGKILANEVLPETARQLVIMTGADKAEGIDTITKSTNRLTDAWIKLVRATAESKVGAWIDESVTGFFDTISGTLEKITLQVKGFNASLKDAALVGQGIGEKSFRTDFRTAAEDPKNRAKTQEQIRTTLREGYIWEFNAAKDNLNRLEKLRQNADIANRTQREQDVLEAKITFQEAATKIRLSRIQVEKETSTTTNELSDADKKKQEKRDKDRLDAAKRLSDSEYELQKQKLERSIKLNEDVSKDDKQSDEVRIASLEASNEKQIALTELTKKHSLDADKFVTAENKLNADQKTFIANEAANKIVDINKKTSEEIDKINEFDSKSYEDKIKRELAEIEIKNNDAVISEEKRFQDELALGYENDKAKEKAAQDHERELFRIKKQGLIDTAKIQLKYVNDELSAYEKKAKEDGIITQEESDFILEKRRKLKELSVGLIQAEGETFKENEKEKGKSAKEQTEDILQISSEALGALSDLSNAFSERKIQKIDEEINKNNEYYDKQIELAGNDVRQKELLEKERDKKNTEFEKKKREAQNKQAKIDKAVTIAQIAIATALAIIKAAPNPVTVTFAAVLGAISLATAIATPIPKYKLGRKGGPAEMAWVGDGGVSEVIERKSGRIELTPNIPTLTHLGQGDIVHSSVDSYDKSIRASILYGFEADQRKISEFQSIQFENNNKELVKEMQLTRQAIEKNKTNITVNVPKVDMPHEMWKSNNKNWNP